MPEMKAWQGHEGPVLDSVKGFDVIECRNCGFRHVLPLPTSEELAGAYAEHYYTREKPRSIQRQGEDLPWWRLVFADRFDVFERFLPSLRRSVLDVGSGPGYFLLCGRERGWEVQGVEPSARAAAHTREMGLPVREMFLTPENAAALGTFDVVHLNAVLEHLPDPRGMIMTASRLLAPGGLLCAAVPNDYNPLQEALRSARGFSPWWVAPPHHLNYFDHSSLGRLLANCGFEILAATSSFPMELFLLMGEDYVGDDARGRACHGKRMMLESNLEAAGRGELKRRLYIALAQLGMGREAVLVGRKP
jgi:SAM-dependent methyltransferase